MEIMRKYELGHKEMRGGQCEGTFAEREETSRA